MSSNKTVTTKQIYNWFRDTVGQKIAVIGLLKVLSIASAKLTFPRLNLIHSAPSGHLKTWTSNTASRFFSKSWTLPLKSDFTIHRLYEKTKGNVDRKCLIVNDATLLFSSKSEKTKQRLVNGLAEIMTDNEYEYGDFQRCFTIKGQISIILNITTESYNQNLKRLLGNTFDERCLTVHSELSLDEQKRLSTIRLGSDYTYILSSFPSRKVEISIPQHFENKIFLCASEYSWKSLKGFPRTQSIIRAMLRSSAFLNGRTEVNKEDFWIIEKTGEYLINPLQPNKPMIVQMLRNKQSIIDICRSLGKDYESYNSYVYRVMKEAIGKGLINA
jgi:hypothetical protein